MIWPFTPAIAAYLVVAALVWMFGLSLVGKSPTGRTAVPIVAALWPLALLFLLLVGGAAAFDAAIDRALDQVFGADPLTGSGRSDDAP